MATHSFSRWNQILDGNKPLLPNGKENWQLAQGEFIPLAVNKYAADWFEAIHKIYDQKIANAFLMTASDLGLDSAAAVIGMTAQKKIALPSPATLPQGYQWIPVATMTPTTTTATASFDTYNFKFEIT